MTRIPLPNRRHGVTIPVEHRNQTFFCTFSFDDAGVVREAFMRSTKEGNDFSALMVDACIAVSMLLQHGESSFAITKFDYRVLLQQYAKTFIHSLPGQSTLFARLCCPDPKTRSGTHAPAGRAAGGEIRRSDLIIGT